MDFNDTAEETAWREEFRAWLEKHAPEVTGEMPEHELEIGGGDYLERAKRLQPNARANAVSVATSMRSSGSPDSTRAAVGWEMPVPFAS